MTEQPPVSLEQAARKDRLQDPGRVRGSAGLQAAGARRSSGRGQWQCGRSSSGSKEHDREAHREHAACRRPVRS